MYNIDNVFLQRWFYTTLSVGGVKRLAPLTFSQLPDLRNAVRSGAIARNRN